MTSAPIRTPTEIAQENIERDEREQKLVDAVALEIARAEAKWLTPAGWRMKEAALIRRSKHEVIQTQARAAIAAVREHETCANCGHKLQPETRCLECQLLKRSQETPL